MTEPSIEEIVVRFESRKDDLPGSMPSGADICTLIASWRERGEMIDAIHVVLNEHDGDDAVGRIRDVLYGGAEDKI